MAREQSLMNEIIRYLKVKGYLTWRANSGLVKNDRGRYVRLMPAGFSDVFGITDRGMAFFIEVKTPNGRPTPQQLEFLKSVRSFGCYGGVATCIEEVEDILKGGVGNAKKFNMEFKRGYINWEEL